MLQALKWRNKDLTQGQLWKFIADREKEKWGGHRHRSDGGLADNRRMAASDRPSPILLNVFINNSNKTRLQRIPGSQAGRTENTWEHKWCPWGQGLALSSLNDLCLAQPDTFRHAVSPRCILNEGTAGSGESKWMLTRCSLTAVTKMLKFKTVDSVH